MSSGTRSKRSERETRYLKTNKCKEVYFLVISGEEYRLMNMGYLRNIINGMKYQDGMDVDIDNMTYEELLEL